MLLVAAMLLGSISEKSASYGPPDPGKPSANLCVNETSSASTESDDGTVVVCGERPPTYRLNPDILEAQRNVREKARPKPPETNADNSCRTVGPAGCPMGPTINLLQVAAVANSIAKKAASGENVGETFVTRPELSEYEHYMIAKKAREERERLAAAPPAPDGQRVTDEYEESECIAPSRSERAP